MKYIRLRSALDVSLRLAVCAAILSCAAGCRAQTSETEGPAAPPPPGVEVLNVEIGQGGGRTLHAEIARPKVPSATPMPAVLFFHGGGWIHGNYMKMPPFLVPRGYLMASIEYRLSKEAKWPAQIEDCKLGVRWLRANAAKYNVDPNRIGCWGVSAGGQLAACVGTMDAPELEGQGGYPGVSSKVAAVADFSGPTDFTGGNFGKGSVTITTMGLMLDKVMETSLFGSPLAANPALWKQASPLFWVRAGDPPFFILHGDQDEVVSPRQSTALVAALQKAGVPVQFVMVKGGHHSTVQGDPDFATQVLDLIAFFNQYLKK